MSQAFIFDLDGVLIDDEQIWEKTKQKLYQDFFGSEVAAKLGSTLGVNMDDIYDKAVAAGAQVDKQRLLEAFYGLAEDIYRTAPITEGVENLAAELKKLGYRLAIVSASPTAWIATVMDRLSFKDDVQFAISLHERDDLQHKPAPDGYIEAMSQLKAIPHTTIILEDSNSGIAAAKASGAFTIGLKQNLVRGYVQQGADAYAQDMQAVVGLVRQRTKQA